MNTGSPTIDPLRRDLLESELKRATDMVRQGNARYWLAFCRGLRRGYGGPEAVSDGEHERWLRLHPALHREEIAGYGDALLSATRAGATKITTGGAGEVLSMTVYPCSQAMGCYFADDLEMY